MGSPDSAIREDPLGRSYWKGEMCMVISCPNEFSQRNILYLKNCAYMKEHYMQGGLNAWIKLNRPMGYGSPNKVNIYVRDLLTHI
jgi:hypothetical protein